MPLPKYGERHASVCAYLCFSIVGVELPTFQKTIALQRFVLSIGIGFCHPKRQLNYIILSWITAIAFVDCRGKRKVLALRAGIL